jgi:hypothetical protein
MIQFIRCAKTGVPFPLSRVSHIEPVNERWSYPFVAIITNGGGRAYLYDHDVDELQATYVPAPAGTTVYQACYNEDDDEMWHCEVPVIAWRLERGDVEPIGVEGKIAEASNAWWLAKCPGERVIDCYGSVYDNIEIALEALKNDHKRQR